jgi:ribosome modulation factor
MTKPNINNSNCPINDPNDPKRKIWWMGYDAYYEGINVEECPSHLYSCEKSQWKDGWLTAMQGESYLSDCI